MKSIQNNKWLNYGIKVAIFIALGMVLYHQVFKNKLYGEILDTLHLNLSRQNILRLVFVFILMGLNWFIEILKWKILVGKIRKISWLKAIKGILFGITFSLFTPNRIGEFGGRVLAFKANRLPAFVATLVGSFSQIVMNLSMGSTALVLYLLCFSEMDFFIKAVFFFFYILLIFSISIIYYNLELVNGMLLKIPFLNKLKSHFEIIKTYDDTTLFYLQMLSGLRYLIYSIQYLMLIHFFGVEIGNTDGLILVSCIFFVQTILPSLAILDIAFRSAIAIFFLENFTNSELGVGIATFSLWVINLIIPGIFGAFAAWQFKFVEEE